MGTAAVNATGQLTAAHVTTEQGNPASPVIVRGIRRRTGWIPLTITGIPAAGWPDEHHEARDDVPEKRRRISLATTYLRR